MPANTSGTDVKPIRRLLVIYEVSTAWPGIRLIDKGIRSTLDALPYKVDVYQEYMDTIYFPDPADQQRFREFYIRKYQNRRPDVIITEGPSPLKFMLEAHDRAFPGVPIIVCLPNWEPGSHAQVGFAGVDDDISPIETLEAAFHLNPAIKHVVVVGGTSAIDVAIVNVVKEKLRPYEAKYGVSYLQRLSMPDIVERLKNLPSDTIVLFTSFSKDAAGSNFTSGGASAIVAAAASVPVFSLGTFAFDHGEVGGKLSSLEEEGRTAGELAVRALNGEEASKLPRVMAATTYMFDWRALKRWGFRERDLPPGSIVLNRQPTFWELYKWYVIVGLTAIVAQLALIIILVMEMHRRKKSDSTIKNLSGRLINAGEEERKRIARELHDDIGQRLSLLSIELDGMERELPANQVAEREALSHSLQQINELVTDVHNLSHQLHSSKLQMLGLPVALREICRQVGSQHEIEIELTADDIPSPLPEDLALCFYRVAQEALNNSVKHSAATRAEVRVAVCDGTLKMTIKDDGTGFDPAVAARGLGLATMRERLRLVGGDLVVSSKLGQGTEVTAQARLDRSLRQTTAA
jgi:signal transduction histidine kinase